MDDNPIFLTILFLPLMMMGGCGGGSSSSSSDAKSADSALILEEPYQEKSGDTFTRSLTTNNNFLTRRPETYHSLFSNSISTVNEIPQKYGYSNAIAGPYLLDTTTSGNDISSLRYSTPAGELIIGDSLTTFTNIEYTTQRGSDAPNNIRIGDTFDSYENTRLFDSSTGEDIGYETFNMGFTVIAQESITTPAGEFNAVRLHLTTEYSSVTDRTISYSGSGQAWYDTNLGLLIKTSHDLEYSGPSLNGTSSSVSELQAYSLSQNRELAKPTLSIQDKGHRQFPVNVSKVFNDLRLAYAHEILESIEQSR